MSSYRKKSSSSEDGEVSGENSDHQDEDIVPTKVSNKKLWSNVMLDQTADDVIAGVNAFEGSCSNRDVESYQPRKRRRSETDELDVVLDSVETRSDVFANSEQINGTTQPNVDDSLGAGKRRKCVVYDDDSTNNDNEETYRQLDQETTASDKIPHELDVTFEDVIVESSAFLDRAKQRHMRPPKDPEKTSKQDVIRYLTWLLNEKNTELLERLLDIKTIGFVYYIVDRTITKEKEGGILTNSGIRKRLPGGVFISLLKVHLSQFERLVVLDGKSQLAAKNLCVRKSSKKNRKRAAKLRKKQNDKKSLEDAETLKCNPEVVMDNVVNNVLQCESDEEPEDAENEAALEKEINIENMENGNEFKNIENGDETAEAVEECSKIDDSVTNAKEEAK